MRCPYRKGQFGHRDRHTQRETVQRPTGRRPCEEGVRGWRDRARGQARSGAVRSWILPTGSEGVRPASAFWTPGLRSVEQSTSVVLGHPICAALWWSPQERSTERMGLQLPRTTLRVLERGRGRVPELLVGGGQYGHA